MNERESSPADADDFRWQGFFQRSTDPLFLLNRQRRLLFVNRAWETLAGLSAAQARGLICRKHQPAGPNDSLEDVLSHVLCPPLEVVRGAAAAARRLVPAPASRTTAPRWWDVEFLPLRAGDTLRGILGRIKPVPVETPAEAAPLPEKIVALRQRAAARYGIDWLSSDVPAMRRLAEQVRLAASLHTPALIVGEPGSGKESVARVLHLHSGLREKAFIALDCARLPFAAVAEVLLTTQATAHRQVAGTVYLHEPRRLPRDLQQGLVHLLTAADAPRLLAGCCTDPDEDVRAGRLLPELWCALSVLVLRVPPLRERRADLPLLVKRILLRAAPVVDNPVTELTPAAWDVLRGHTWPGNLRELVNVLSVACIAAKGRIDAADLPASLRLTQRLATTSGNPVERPLPLDKLLEQTERRLIQLALQRARGNKRRAAELLDISRPRLTRRMEVLGLIESELLAELELEEDE
jgi:transcriptional regulator with PAS, ATPase and Fis domain